MIAMCTQCLAFLAVFLLLSLPAYGQWMVVSPESFTHNFVAASFVDEMRGFAVGFVEISTGTGGVQSTIARTTDGGATWKSENFSQVQFNSVHAVDANRVYVAGRGRNCGCPVFVRSTDGGATWSEEQLTDVEGAFQAVDFYDANIGAVGGGDPLTGTGYIYRILDGSSELVRVSGDDLPHVSRIDMVSPDHVFAAAGAEAGAENTIFAATNFSAKGPVVWDERGRFDGFVSIGSMDFLDAELGYAALTTFDGGEFTGDVYRTTNGGADWERLFRSPAFTLVGIDFLDADNGFAVGANGAIVHTTNGGADWDENITFIAQLLPWVEYVSPTVAYATGTDGTIMKYTRPASVSQESGVGKLRVEIAPNPVTDFSFVRVVGDGAVAGHQLRLSDALGREVERVELQEGQGTLQAKALPPGVYFYRLLKGEEIVTTGGIVVQ